MNNDYYKEYSKENLAQAFLQVINTVKSHLTDLNENVSFYFDQLSSSLRQNVEKVLDEIDKTKIDEEVVNETFIAKNVRVKQIDAPSERTKTADSMGVPVSKLNIDDRHPVVGSRIDESICQVITFHLFLNQIFLMNMKLQKLKELKSK